MYSVGTQCDSSTGPAKAKKAIQRIAFFCLMPVLAYFLSKITRSLSSAAATKIASSFAGFVLLAFSLSV